MAFYSFVVMNDSGDVVVIPENLLTLDTGRNVFSTQVEDVEHFVDQLRQMGVRVTAQHRLDEHDLIEDPPDLLPE